MGGRIQPRHCLRMLTPYLPGKSIASAQRELGLKSVIKLASNENPLGPSPKAMAAYRSAQRQCGSYPEESSAELREALARFHGIESSRVLVGSGSDEVIRLVCEAFLDPGDEVIASQYAFIRFRQQALMMGAHVVEVPMVDWTHDLETMGKTASARTKIVFVANPNNPTGTYNTREEILKLLKVLPPSTILLLYEEYHEFARGCPDYPDSIPALADSFENLVVLRTFSKAYGLAGLRAGYGVADPEIIGWLDRIRMPFNVSLPAQQACMAALKDRAFVKRSAALACEGREVLATGLRELGFCVQDSAANFVFAHSPVPGRELFKEVLKRGVIIRTLDEYGLRDCARFSIGTRIQNRALLAAVRQALGALS